MANKPVGIALYEHLLLDLSPLFPDGDLTMDPFPGITFQQFSATAIAKALTKKFQDDIDPVPADAAAFLKFLECNEGCRGWAPPSCDGSFRSEYEQEMLGQFREELGRFFDAENLSSWAAISFRGTNGPGSCIGGSGSSWFEKFANSTLTYSTEFLFDLYRERTRGHWTHSEVEESRDMRLGHEKVTSSRLETVPKTVSESRCICIEPSLNVFFQKGLSSLMTERLEQCFGINLETQQEINGRLAHLGSVDGSFGTIDLTSASDTISMDMLTWALGRSGKRVLDVIKVLRTPSVDTPWGARIPLHMVSTMGNAFTFPLQTAIFSAVVKTIYRLHEVKLIRSTGSDWRGLGNFGVNGDDIIVLREQYDDVIHLLMLLGFKPNEKKSFNEGLFRESCGRDYFDGREVRGVYCKTLRTDQDCFSLINRLNRWSARSGIKLPHTVGFVLRRLQGRRLKCPPYESDTAGIHMPLEMAKPARSFNASRAALLNPKIPYYGSGWGYEYARFVPTKRALGCTWEETGEELALILLCAKGENVGQGLVSRRDDGFFTICQGSSPNWDMDQGGEVLSKDYMRKWYSACYENLAHNSN